MDNDIILFYYQDFNVPIVFQETRVLVIFESEERDSTYDTAIETIAAMSKVVDRLYQTAQKLT
jgi:hypothetical protein